MAKASKGASKPTHRAFSVEEREGRDAYWTELGAAFAHQDEKGFNIQLRALPVDGRIVLRVIEEKKDK